MKWNVTCLSLTHRVQTLSDAYRIAASALKSAHDVSLVEAHAADPIHTAAICCCCDVGSSHADGEEFKGSVQSAKQVLTLH